MTPDPTYPRFLKTIKEIETLNSIGSLLNWDQEVMMPPKGADFRAEQSSLVARLAHERFTSPQVDELLNHLAGSPLVADPESDAAAVVREVRRSYDRARKLPPSLVEEMARTATLAHPVWVDARKRSDYAAYQPWLERSLKLKREEAACVGYDGHVYNALLDPYEPDETAENLTRVFESLRGPLVDLVGRIASSGKKAPVEILQRTYPAAAQHALGVDAARRVGFDFDAGRLDISVHPFCSGIGPGDTRMTTRYDEHYFGDAFFGVLHETGHCLYEQGLPAEHAGTPLAQAVSLGIHESQSRMWENLVGRGRPFWNHFFPKAKAAFPDALKDVGEDQWLFAINDVSPSLIRVEADEATYNLHVLLRFELEQAMLTGDLSTNDVPAAWNERMNKYLGLTPPDDARGCLQDVHWSHGSIGYFPTYTLGNLYAAQFYEQAKRDVSGLEAGFERGDFAPLLAWLRTNIHRHGKRYSARDLVKRITGQPLSARPLLDHLERKAKELYGV